MFYVFLSSFILRHFAKTRLAMQPPRVDNIQPDLSAMKNVWFGFDDSLQKKKR